MASPRSWSNICNKLIDQQHSIARDCGEESTLGTVTSEELGCEERANTRYSFPWSQAGPQTEVGPTLSLLSLLGHEEGRGWAFVKS